LKKSAAVRCIAFVTTMPPFTPLPPRQSFACGWTLTTVPRVAVLNHRSLRSLFMACSPLSTVGLVRFDFNNAANVDSHAFHRLDLHFIERKSMRSGKQLRQSRLFDSEAVEGSIFFHLFQKASVDQLLGRDLGRA